MLHLFQWKTLCKDSFLYFSIFSNIKKNKSKENYFWSVEKVRLIFKDCFSTNDPFGLKGREGEQSKVEQIQHKISLFLTNSTLPPSTPPPPLPPSKQVISVRVGQTECFSLFAISTYFCNYSMYSWDSLHFLVLFINLIILFS